MMAMGRRIALIWAALLWSLAAGALAQEAQTPTPDVPADTAAVSQGDDATTGDQAAVVEVTLPGIDLDAWETLAKIAQKGLESPSTANRTFETFRAQIADYRRQFLDAQTINATRIDTLDRQLEGLGPVPEAGDDEATAARRAELEKERQNASAPARRAEEAYERANGLIAEIDAVIRERQTDQLLELGPSPLNPANWPSALRALSGSINSVTREVSQAVSLETRREELRLQAPAIGLFLALGLVLILRGRHWARRAALWALEGRRRGGRTWNFVLSLGQILLPLAGVFALKEALDISDLLGLRGTLLLGQLTGWALLLLAVRWLAERLFGGQDSARILPMSGIHRTEALTYAGLFAFVAVARNAWTTVADFDGYGSAVRAVVDFPVLFISAIALVRLGLILARHVNFQVDEESSPPVEARVVPLLGRWSVLVGVLGPILAAVGFGAAAQALVYPTISTLLLLGAVIVLQRFTGDLYRYLTGQRDEDEDSLISVLISFILTLGVLPGLALIWGARVADLTEVWTRFREGFDVGGTRIQPTDFITFVVVFGLLYSATRLLQASLRNTVLPKTTIDKGGQTAIVSGVGYVGVFLAALIAISATGLDLSSIALVAGALSVGIGFGLQNIVSNFVSGIILLIERPIAEGDWIEVGGYAGYVRDISVRSTRIQTFDRSDVIVPNADLVSGTVTNYTRGNTIGRVIVPVGVAYGTDTRKVEDILLSIARQHDMVLMNPAPSVVFQGFGADSMDFEIRAVLRDVNWVLSVKSDMNHEIAKRFSDEDIEIPFAQRDLWIRNPEALRAPPQDAETETDGSPL